MGFFATEDDPYAFLDFDDVVDADTGESLKPWVFDIVEKLDSYAEWSPSGCGLRVGIKGKTNHSSFDYLLDGEKLEACRRIERSQTKGDKRSDVTAPKKVEQKQSGRGPR